VAVLNGIVLIGYFNQLKTEGMTDIMERIITGTKVRLRPVIMTAAVASLGFLPMAISTSGGAEVQRPLATVVIGGLITATFLTLVILPILYNWLERWNDRKVGRTINSKGISMSILLLLGTVTSSTAQDQILTLDEAIQMAVSNHPKLKAASLDIEKNQSLQNLKYNLGNTDISYQGDGLFDTDFGQQVNQIGIVQNIPHPGVNKAQNKMQDAYAMQSVTQKELSENEVEWNVKQLYFDIQYKKEMEKLYANLASTYQEYYDKAEVRVKVGAANPIEALTIKSKWQEYQLLLRQVELEITNLEKQFQLLLNTSSRITVEDKMNPVDHIIQESVDNNLSLLQTQQNIAIQSAKVDVVQSALKPSFNVGYAAQRFYEGGWLSAAEVGVSLPLFNGQTKKKVQAQKMQIDIGNYEYENQLLVLSQEKLSIETKVKLYQAGIDFYSDQMRSVNPEILRISNLNYQAGQLSYLELLNTLQLLATNNRNYLEQILAYNKAVADYQFLTNQ
jgi:cobalt-zinc-cadmium resistance protein CzcA